MIQKQKLGRLLVRQSFYKSILLDPFEKEILGMLILVFLRGYPIVALIVFTFVLLVWIISAVKVMFMIELSCCGACKYYIGLGDDKVTRFCEAFPNGQKDFEPTKGNGCAKGYRFIPKEEYRRLFEKK